jgi:hypothetical protein
LFRFVSDSARARARARKQKRRDCLNNKITPPPKQQTNNKHQGNLVLNELLRIQAALLAGTVDSRLATYAAGRRLLDDDGSSPDARNAAAVSGLLNRVAERLQVPADGTEQPRAAAAPPTGALGGGQQRKRRAAGAAGRGQQALRQAVREAVARG